MKTRCGWHWNFRAPAELLRSRDLFDSAELKAEVVYVVAPPSMHPSGRRYKLIPSPTGKLATLPRWITEALAERQQQGSGTVAVTLEPDEVPILQGTRNRILFKIACSLRARGADNPTIAAHLTGVNAARCSPPLEHDEIAKIAFNVCGRYAPGTAAPHVNGEVHAELDTYALAS